MKHISFNPRFVNKAGNDLIPSKIHTIRQNYEYWKRFEGKEVALFTWEGKPYQPGSKHKVFCTKRIISVQAAEYANWPDVRFYFHARTCVYHGYLGAIAKNDGFASERELIKWFADYKPGKMAILHFTDFRY